jgi:hypothetical protein
MRTSPAAVVTWPSEDPMRTVLIIAGSVAATIAVIAVGTRVAPGVTRKVLGL